MLSDREPINVLLAVSNNILCEGVQRILAENADFKVFADANVNKSAVPDVLLFDVNQDLQALQLAYPRAKPILLDTGLKDQEIACLLVCHKIMGIVSPAASIEMFFKAINVVYHGEIWIDQRHLKSLLQRSGSLGERGDIKSLSTQDKRIVQLITRGLKNRQIGVQLCLSEHTIKAHVSRIYKRLNVANRAQLASLAKEYDAELHQL